MLICHICFKAFLFFKQHQPVIYVQNWPDLIRRGTIAHRIVTPGLQGTCANSCSTFSNTLSNGCAVSVILPHRGLSNIATAAERHVAPSVSLSSTALPTTALQADLWAHPSCLSGVISRKWNSWVKSYMFFFFFLTWFAKLYPRKD